MIVEILSDSVCYLWLRQVISPPVASGGTGLLPVGSAGNLSTSYGEMWFTGHLNPQEDACDITQKYMFPSFQTLKLQ